MSARRSLLFLGVSAALLLSISTGPATAGASCGAWRRAAVPLPHAATQGRLNGVDVLASDDAWAVGWAYTTETRAMIEHWDGGSWAPATIPNGPGYRANLLDDVAGIAPDDVWAVGMANDSYNDKWPLIEHWDGNAWSVVSDRSFPGEELTAVVPLADDDVWAAGFFSQKPLLMHYDGMAWSMVPAPATDDRTSLWGLSASGPADIWAVGYSIPPEWHPVALHYDGRSWTLVPSPAPDTRSLFWDVAAISPSLAYAVGLRQVGTDPQRPLVERWNGVAWKVASAVPTRSGHTSLMGVGSAPGGIVGVGTGQPDPGVEAYRPFVLRRAGPAWDVQASQSTGHSYNSLNDVSVLPSGEGWSVGSYGEQSSTLPLALSYCP